MFVYKIYKENDLPDMDIVLQGSLVEFLNEDGEEMGLSDFEGVESDHEAVEFLEERGYTVEFIKIFE